MSKKFKNKVCVYCAKSPSTGADHVFAREFFLVKDRSGLPKVPACGPCNRKKSELEHYATSVLPFGGRHATARINLETLVLKRLEKNSTLCRTMNQGLRRAWVRESDGLIIPTTTLPVDSGHLANLVALIAKGLIWHHWQTYLTSDHFVDVKKLTPAGERFFDEKFFSPRSRDRVNKSFGSGTFCYEGVQAVDCMEITVWRFTMFGGVWLGGDAQAPNEISSKVGVMTGPIAIYRNALI